MTLKQEARNRGIRVTYDKDGKRVRKPNSVIVKEIRNHDESIISERVEQTKGMIMMCKAIMSTLDGRSEAPKKVKTPPPPPPPPTKNGNAKASSPPIKNGNAKASLMNALKKNPKFIKAKKNLV